MKKMQIGLLVAALLPLLLTGHDSFRLEKKSETARVFTFSSPNGAKTVKIDNVFGSITVRSARISEARLQAVRVARADSQADLDKAEREVTLRMAEKDNVIDVCVDVPFRRGHGCLDGGDPDYIVAYQFVVQVPEDVTLQLRTVNDGDIRVENVRGEFTLRNVNGGIEMQGAAGSGSCRTVNGVIRASFRENPTAACVFRTVNGDIDLRFAPGLSADFKLKTFNGEAYSDFPVSYLPGRLEQVRRESGHAVYRGHGFRSVRVGEGGPEITLDTLNGDIVIAGEKSK